MLSSGQGLCLGTQGRQPIQSGAATATKDLLDALANAAEGGAVGFPGPCSRGDSRRRTSCGQSQDRKSPPRHIMRPRRGGRADDPRDKRSKLPLGGAWDRRGGGGERESEGRAMAGPMKER